METLCSDCPPFSFLSDETRCAPCPRRTTKAPTSATQSSQEVGDPNSLYNSVYNTIELYCDGQLNAATLAIVALLRSQQQPVMARPDEWKQGFAVAVATLNRMRDRPTSCKEVLMTVGTVIDFARCGLAEYDLKEIRKIYRQG